MMDINSRETEYLLEVLRAAVSGKKPAAPPEGIDWDEFFELSKKQQVYSMVAQAVDISCLPSHIAQELNNSSKSELVRLIAMQNELTALKSELEKNKIKYMLLKGSVIRNYYPKQSMRQMSDVDILYDVSKRNVVFEIMKGRGYKLCSLGTNSDDFSKKPFYTFEFHRELFKNENGFCPDFSFVWDNAKKAPDNEYEYIMSVEDLYLHHIAHMYKHCVLGGFGVRFLADTYLLVSKEQSKWNKKYIDKKLNEFSLSEFEKQINRITFAVFECLPLSSKDAEFFNDKIGFGIYGNQRVGIEILYDEYQKEKGSSSPIGYLLYRLFPNKKFMQREYPVLKDKPYLLLFCYVIRVFSKSKVSLRKAKTEIKTVKKISKEQKNK